MKITSTHNAGLLVLSLLAAPCAFGTANYVYHERSGNNPGCGGQYVTRLNPTVLETYPLRFKVEYQFYVTTGAVYYTTDGSAPIGSFGNASNTTQVLPASFVCTFDDPNDQSANLVDVWESTIPAVPAGTVVKYIVSAWHTGGGAEIFANSGEFINPFDTSGEATVFQYTVGSFFQLYWDANGATAGAGGPTPTGVWGTDMFWSQVFDGTATTGGWVDNDVAVFAAGNDATGSYTVTLSGPQTAGSLVFEEGQVTLSGVGPTTNLTLTTTVGVEAGAGASATLSVPVAGTSGLTKSGAGTLSLTAANTYTGNTVVNQGVLSLANADNNLGATPGAFTADALTINDATVRFGNGVVTFPANRGVTLGGSGAIIDMPFPANSSVWFIPNVIDGSGTTLTKTGIGEFGLYGAANKFAKLVIDAGRVRIGQASFNGIDESFGAIPASVLPDAVTIRNGATNRIAGGAAVTTHANRGFTMGPGGGVLWQNVQALTINGPITGPGGMTKIGQINMTVNGPIDYQGDTVINGVRGGNVTPETASQTRGIVTINGYNNTPGNLIVREGRLIINNGSSYASVLLEGGRIDANTNNALGTGVLTIAPAAGQTNPVLLAQSTTLGTGPLTNAALANDIVLTPGPVAIDISANAGRELILNGKISGAGNWRKDNSGSAGNVVLANGANDFSGTATCHAGMFVATADGALGSTAGGVVILNNASLAFRGGVNYATAEPVEITGRGRNGTGAIRNLSGNNAFNGPITMAGNSAIGADADQIVVSGSIGQTGGPAALTNVGAGLVILTAANTYAGGTIVRGNLRVANTTGSATGPGPVTIDPSGSFSGPGTVAGTVTVNGTISPGASPGTQNTGPQTWNGGGSYLWEINDVDAGVGADPGWDVINITGGLTINATPGSKFNINITSLTLANSAGNVHDFDNTSDYTWTILTTTSGISGFDATAFNLNTSGFSNPLGAAGLFVIEQNGNNLQLRFVRAPAITADPISQTTECTGGSTFTVTATGTAPLAYQWRKGGVNLTDGGNISGATTPTLTLNPTLTPDAGSYDVVVANAFGTATSSAATLTVVDTVPPMITCAPNATAECGSAWDFTEPTASDTCAGNNVTITTVSTVTNNVAGGYAVTRTWQATDPSNNSAQCTQTITVLDTVPPAITCPGDIVTCTPSNSAVVTFSASATDACDNDVAIVCSPASGSDFPVGATLVTCTADDGVNTAMCSFNVTVRQNTTAAGPTDTTVCEGGSATLSTVASGTGPHSYVWRKDGQVMMGETSPSITINNASSSDAAQYCVEVTGTCNSVTNCASLTVNNLVTAVGPTNTTVCRTSNVVLRTEASGAGPFTYVWKRNDVVIPNETNSSLTLNNVDEGDSETYCVEITGACSSVTNCAVLLVNVPPSAGITPAGGTICAGQSITLTANTDATNPSYLWSPGGQTSASITVSPTTSTVYSVAITDGNTTCTAHATVGVDVNPVPMVSINSPTICAGQTATLTATTDAATPSYLWSPGGETTQSIMVTPSSTTTYTCTVTDGTTGCSNSASGIVTVNPNPNVSVNSPTICAGQSATLTATTDAANPSYLWSPGGETTQSITVSPSSTTTYSVTVTDGNTSCSSGASGTVTVNPVPNVSVNSATICAGQSATLSATTDAANPSYLWSPGGETSSSITVSPGSTTTYTVTVTDGNTGCSKSGSGTVTVNPLPSVSVNSVTVCDGGSATLTATTDAASPTYLWSPGGETTSSITVSPAATTTYTCTVTDGATGCSSSGSGTVTVRGYDSFANSGSISINDNSTATPYPSPIVVSGLTATVCRVKVTLHNINHDFPDDIDIVLVGPNNEGSLLMSDNGGGNAISGVTLTFDDFAASMLPDSSQIVSGTFKPSNVGAKSDGLSDIFPPPAPTVRFSTNLSVFNGINPNGTWSLYMVDDELIDAGQIAGGWSLDISTLDPIADIAVSQQDVPDPVAVGSNLTYTVIVSNLGPATASGVTLSDTLPAGVTFVSATPSQGSCTQSGGIVSCALGSIDSGASATVAIVVTPTATGTIVNSASAASAAVDFVPGNNSASASTTVRNPPVITTAPQNQVVCAGQNASFSVTATGDEPLSYQWSHDGTPIPGATNPSLTINGAQAADAGTYSVTVANDVGATSASATLTVNPLPMVSVNSPTICNGQSATLTATTDAANPSYLWSPGGQTTSSITVSPTTTTTYTVTVTDGNTSCSNSASGTVTVNQLTTATALTSVSNACPGTSVSFTTTAGGTGPHSYRWTKDGVEIGGALSETYTIASVAASDAGTYCVEVTGVCNTVTNCATLTVAVAPTITAQPQNQIRPMGNTATFSVTASSAVPATYQWRREGTDIGGATSSSYTTATLTLADNGATFDVIVSNCAGSVTSVVATLTVTPITGISFDFNSPGQYTNTPYYMVFNDWLNVSEPPNTILPGVTFESPDGGVGPVPGSGALNLINANGQENTITLLPVTYDFSLDGKTLTASAMFKAKAPTANNRSTQIGFVVQTNTGINNGAAVQGPQAFMTAILQSTAQPALTYQLRLQHKTFGANAVEVTPSTTTASLTAGSWYKVTVKFINLKATAANTFSVEASLQDMGVLGDAPGAALLSYAPTNIVNADIVNASRMHLAIRGFENTGVDFRDNIYAYTQPGAPVFVASPGDQTVLHGRRAIFKALVDGEGPYTYQWYRNGEPIPGANNWKFMTGPVSAADNGAQYMVQVTNPIDTNFSDPATLNVQPDPLAVVSVGSVDGCNVGVRFNQAVHRASAENPANYLINGQPAFAARVYISSLGVQGLDGVYVVLTPQTELSGNFTVQVQNVQDVSGNLIGAMNTASGATEGLTGVDVNPSITAPVGEQYSFAPDSFEITGGGADIFGTADQFRYVYGRRTGDFDVKVRVPAQNVVRIPSKAGLEARASLDPSSPHVLASPNPMHPGRNFFEGTTRPSYNAATVGWGSNNAIQTGYPDVWVRLRRVGSTFLRYSSTDGQNWRFDGQTTQPAMPDTVYLGLAVCAVANNNPHTAQFASYGDFAGYPGATIAITTQPVSSATVNGGGSTNLSVVATLTGGPAAGELAYQWQRSDGSGGWTNVPTAGTTNNVFNTGALFITDNGAKFRVIVKAAGAADVTSSETTITVNDSGAPTLSNAGIPALATHQVAVVFSEPVTAPSATTAGNYVVTNVSGVNMGVTSAAFLGADNRTVILTTSSQLVLDSYGVRVSNVQDLNGNTIAANSLRTFSQVATPPATAIIVEHYGGLANAGNIGDLTGNIKFTTATPDFIGYSNVFGINPVNANFPGTLDNYGARIYSYFVPPTNGNYKFYIRADDFAEFLMNTNNTGDSTSRAGAVVQRALTANAQAYSAANSVTNNLLAGRAYYIELRFKETTGGDGGTLAIRNDNTVPGQGEVAAGSLFAYPSAVAPAITAVAELYTGLATTGLPGPDFGLAVVPSAAPQANGNFADLMAATNSLAFQARLPNFVGFEKTFNVASNLVNTSYDNYLGRVFSYFIAPSNGLYRFYVRADDSWLLYMNTNAVNSADPAGKSLLGFLDRFIDGNYRMAAEKVPLIGGQRYYIEGIWREGTGGDGINVAFRAQSNTALPPNTEVLDPSRYEFPGALDRIGPVTLARITPLNPTAREGETITFIGQEITGAAPYGFNWLKNGQQIFANSASFTTLPLTPADNGAVITLVVSNAFSRVERSSTITVLSDNTSPTLVRATGSQYYNTVALTFSETLDPESASCPAYYTINNGVGVLAANLDASRTKVSLLTTPQSQNVTYTVTVNNVRDASGAGNVIAPNSTINFMGWGIGGCGLLVETFTNIAGTAVLNLQTDQKYVLNLPDSVGYANRFIAGPIGWPVITDSGMNNYGVRVSGLFMPPSNGLYRFYIRGDDGTQLFMNTNGPDASGRVLIARNDGANSSAFDNGVNNITGQPSSASPIISLSQGTLYYMEGLMKEGGGGDYMQVAMRAVDPNSLLIIGSVPAINVVQEIIPASFFTVWGDMNLHQFIVNSAPPTDITVDENERVTLELDATILPESLLSAVCYQWQKLNPETSAFTNIAGANQASFTFYPSMLDAESQVRLVFSMPGTGVVFTTTIHINNPDGTAPYIEYTTSLDGRSIDICYTEPVDPAAANGVDNRFNFRVNGGQLGEGIVNVQQLEDLRKVKLTLENPLTANTYTVESFFINDLAVTPNSDVSTASGRVRGFFAGDVGVLSRAGFSFGCHEDELDVVAGGQDIWDATDRGHLTLSPRYGDFDIHARVHSLRPVSAAPDVAKAGLMVRETTNHNSRTMHILVNPPLPLGRDQGEAAMRVNTGAGTIDMIGSFYRFGQVGMPNAWVRIKRVGDRYTAFRSYDGENWIEVSTTRFGLPDPVLVGFATTAHNDAAPTTLAEYRNIHFPDTPTILAHPSPETQTVPLHAAVTYSVVVSNPPNAGPLVYQWKKDGVSIPGATSSSLTISDAQGRHSGTYTVWVGNDGGNSISLPAVLVVNNGVPVAGNDSLSTVQNAAINTPAADLLANDSDPESESLSIVAVSGLPPVSFTADFNTGLPAGTAIFGSATVEPTAGVNGSGAIRLTPNLDNQTGSFILNQLTPGRRISAFTASFKVRIAEGEPAEPADGMSFNFAPDLPIQATTPAAAESGGGTGLSFCIDNYRFAPYPNTENRNPNTSGLKLRYGGLDIAGVNSPTWDRDAWIPVTVSVSSEGVVTVLVDGTNVFGNITVPWVPTAGRFGFYARTGGQNETHAIDDLNITTALTVETAREMADGSRLFGEAYIAGGFLHLTENANGHAGSYILSELTPASAVDSFTATFRLRIGNATAEPADGFSLNFANDIPIGATTPAAAENGGGTGFSFCVDNYRFAPYPGGSTANTSGMKIRYGGVDIAGVQMPTWNSTTFIPVSVSVSPSGALTVMVNGTNVFGSLTLPGWTPSRGRFGLYARTGGQNQTHWVDDLSISVNAAGGPASFGNDFNVSPFGTVFLSNNVVTYAPPTNGCGSDTYYYLVNDGQTGGTSIGQVNVTITEANPAPPTIVSCAPNQTLGVDANCQLALPDLTGLVRATDNCCCLTITQNPPSGTLLGLGTTTVTFTVTDSAGLSATCQSTVSVVDTNPPAITCPADIVAECTNGSGTVIEFTVTASDNCPGVTVACVPPSGTAFPVGTNLVTCTATDAANNTASCTFNVIIRDTTPPSITCPPDVIARADAGQCFATGVILGAPVASDTCGSVGVANNAPAQFPVGETIVTWTATDGQGNTATCTQRVTVLDNGAPVVSCPNNVTIECSASTDPSNTGTPTATDDCDASPTLTYTETNVTTITSGNLSGWMLTTTDSGGPLTATAEFVNGPVTPPLGAGSVRLAVGANGDGAAQLRNSTFDGMFIRALSNLTYSTYRTQDGSGGQMPYIILNVDFGDDGGTDDLLFFEPLYQHGFSTSVPDQGALQTGVWQRWDATAGGWYSANGLAGMTPGAGVKPLSAYIAAFPDAQLAAPMGGAIRIVAGFGAPAWNNFDGNVDAVVINAGPGLSAYDFEVNAPAPCDGTVLARLWTATDDSGNRGNCVQYIRRVDTTAPAIACPANIVTTTDPGACNAVVTYSATATDACDTNALVVNCTPASGSTFPLGSTTVQCTVADTCGNSTNCTFMVTVLDMTAPQITCPANITTNCSSPNGTVVTFAATATDNCTNVTVACQPASGSTFPLGTTMVTCTASDDSANTNACTFTVTVNGDTSRPTLTITRTGVTVKICWPQTCANYLLEGTDDFTNWSSLIIPPSVESGNYCVELPTAANYHFFRLRRQD